MKFLYFYMAKYRKGVFILGYSFDKNKQPIYLLLKRKLHWQGWEFPKGAIEKDEKISEAVKRELFEETGLKSGSMKKYNFSGKYDYDKEYPDRKGLKGQTFEALYAVQVKPSDIEKVKIDGYEHSDYKWLNFDKAIKILTWENKRQSMGLVHLDLISNKITGFRKELTSSGKLLLAGKTEANNEELIKKQVKPNELVFHTIARGSPFVVIKGTEKPSKQDIKEAGIFCAKHSHDWRDNKKDVKVHYFKGKDIYKTASMKTGTFGIKNAQDLLIKKEWLR